MGRPESIIDRYIVKSSFKVPSGNEYEIFSEVSIFEKEGYIQYFVKEPFSKDYLVKAENLLDIILSKMRYDEFFFKDPVRKILSEYSILRKKFNNVDLENTVKYVAIKNILGYRSITPLLSDNNLEDLSLSSPNSYVQVWHRKYNQSGWITTNIFIDEDEATKIVNRLAFRSGKPLNLFNPILEGILPEKYRVVATWMNEVSPKGSSFTIRKFKIRPFTIVELIKLGLMPVSLAAYLWLSIALKKFVMIIGPSGAGKTTLVNSLLLLIPPSKRIISIEEVPELYLYNHVGWKPLVTRYDRDSLEEILTLLKYSLRERADYIILGESRGLEARLVFQGAATGHGCITTFHASTLKELHARLVSKPISLDASMFKLLDTVVILGLVEGIDGYKRKVLKAYKHIGNKWVKFFDYRNNALQGDKKILEIIDRDLYPEYYKKKSFLEYLIKINATDIDEFRNRIAFLHSGKYRYVNGKWFLMIGVNNEGKYSN